MRRLTLSLLLVVTLAAIGLGWGLDKLYDRYGAPATGEDMVLLEEIAGGLSKTVAGLDNAESFIRQWNRHSDITLSLQSYETFQIPQSLQADFLQGTPLTLESENEFSIHSYLPEKRQVLSLSFPYSHQGGGQNTLQLVLTLVFYAGVILVILIWLYPLIKRLLVLRNTAKAFGEGRLDARVDSGGLSFISEIEDEFNHMAQRIQTLVSDNKLLSSAVSHDLRTPLSRLRFGIETLAETYGDVEREQYIDRISQDLDEMESLVESLLAFARMDESRVKIKFTRTDLAQVVSSCKGELMPASLSVDCNLPEGGAYIESDTGFTSMLYANLLKNAVQHARRKVQVQLVEDEKNWCLLVEDDGPGIPAGQRQDVLKPFVRGSGAEKKKGHGLGLAIVSRIAEWHRAGLEIGESAELGGLKVVVTFRKYTEPDK